MNLECHYLGEAKELSMSSGTLLSPLNVEHIQFLSTSLRGFRTCVGSVRRELPKKGNLEKGRGPFDMDIKLAFLTFRCMPNQGHTITLSEQHLT
jgi:hypothetical protein